MQTEEQKQASRTNGAVPATPPRNRANEVRSATAPAMDSWPEPSS